MDYNYATLRLRRNLGLNDSIRSDPSQFNDGNYFLSFSLFSFFLLNILETIEHK